MSYKILPLFKSHFSLGKSILTLEKSENENSIFSLLKNNDLKTLVLVDDNVSGVLQADKYCQDYKLKFIFGLRLSISNNAEEKNDQSKFRKAKYIIFIKKKEGYKNLIKIWSWAAKDGFYYEPVIDFKHLKEFWDDNNLILAVPYYDSFIYLNNLSSHNHIPELDFTNPIFLTESNDLPFEDLLTKLVTTYTKDKFVTLPAQSIFYSKKNDYLAYLTARCISNRTTTQRPELDHMSSDLFNFERWLEKEKN